MADILGDRLFDQGKFARARKAYLRACKSKAMTEYPEMLEQALSIAHEHALWKNEEDQQAGEIHVHTAELDGDHILVIGTDPSGDNLEGFVSLDTLNEYQHVNIDELDYCPACYDDLTPDRKYQ
jgi:hypothetical protein